MNLKVRIKNYSFWLNIVLGAFATALAYAGLTAADMTTWMGVLDVIKSTVQNPYCLFLSAVNVWNALVDPTTQNGVLGMGDSENAKSYTVPKKD